MDGADAAPLDDCGGVPGYEEFVQAMADPNHREHANMKAGSAAIGIPLPSTSNTSTVGSPRSSSYRQERLEATLTAKRPLATSLPGSDHLFAALADSDVGKSRDHRAAATGCAKDCRAGACRSYAPSPAAG